MLYSTVVGTFLVVGHQMDFCDALLQLMLGGELRAGISEFTDTETILLVNPQHIEAILRLERPVLTTVEQLLYVGWEGGVSIQSWTGCIK